MTTLRTDGLENGPIDVQSLQRVESEFSEHLALSREISRWFEFRMRLGDGNTWYSHWQHLIEMLVRLHANLASVLMSTPMKLDWFVASATIVLVVECAVIAQPTTPATAPATSPRRAAVHRTASVTPAVVQAAVPSPVPPAPTTTPLRLAPASAPAKTASEVHPTHAGPAATCPLCDGGVLVPCGRCPSCRDGFPCQNRLCRHCVQPRDMNTCLFCDVTAGEEPCGTCDACRALRSDPCEHAGDGHGPKGEFNPYHYNPFLGRPPRIVTNFYNNGAGRFPVYYNPAPYYRPTWNPSMWGAYQRPFTFRWTCDYCRQEECQCTTGPRAGQTSYAYTCKFCLRTPCACPAEICNVNKELQPVQTRSALEQMKTENANPDGQAAREREERDKNFGKQVRPQSRATGNTTQPAAPSRPAPNIPSPPPFSDSLPLHLTEG